MSSQLLTGERALAGVRQSWYVLVPTIVISVVALAIVFVILHFIPDTMAGHSTQTVTTWIRLIAILVALIAVAKDVVEWRAATYTLTTHRIVMTHGIISRSTESISLDRVQDTVTRKTIFQRLLGCGDIEIESAGRDGLELLHNIPHPDDFYRELMEAMEAYRHPQAPGEPGPSGSAGGGL